MNLNLTTFHFVGLIFMVSLLAGCKASEKVLSHDENTLVVRQRDIPVIIPERKANVAAMISVDDNGHFSLNHINIENDQGVKVNASITPKGELLVDFVAKKDTTRVSATDSTKTHISVSEQVTERKPSIFQRIGAYIGWSAFGAFIIIGIVLFLRNKIKRLWQ